MRELMELIAVLEQRTAEVRVLAGRVRCSVPVSQNALMLATRAEAKAMHRLVVAEQVDISVGRLSLPYRW